MNWRRWFRAGKFILLILIVLLLLAPEWPAFGDEQYRLREIVGLREFDFLVWETDAFLGKGESILAGANRYLDEGEQRAVVLDYLQLMQDARQIEAQLNFIYTDPEIEDPAQSSQELQSQLAATREALEQKQLLAEAIVQQQVGQILIDEGFEALGAGVATGADACDPAAVGFDRFTARSHRKRVPGEPGYGFVDAGEGRDGNGRL